MDSGNFLFIPKIKKPPVIHRAEFGCLKKAYALNVTQGCSFSCVYCYARGYAIAPPKGIVYFYRNLPELIQKEIKHLPIGTTIIFNTASDCFQTHPQVLEITYRVMNILLRRGFYISFLTKGIVPEGFKDLFCRYKSQIYATINVVSLEKKYCNLFEPRAPIGEERLKNAKRLLEWGINVRARLDPLIPFFSDTKENIDFILLELKKIGISEIIVNYLHLRPRIIEQLNQELPLTIAKVIFSCFPSNWQIVGSKTLAKLIPISLRKRTYTYIEQKAKSLGLKVTICRCKNPDLNLSKTCLSHLPLTLKKRLQPTLFGKEISL